MLEPSGFGFAMSGSRTAISQGLVQIEQQVETIENVILTNPALVFDLSRTIVESACRTILTERGVPWNNSHELPQLFRKVRDCLPMLPPHESQAKKVRQSIERTLGGLNSVIQGLAELRNMLGFASHGSDEPRPEMETIQAMLAAQAADAIISFMYHVHSQDSRVSHVRNPAFDMHVDDIHGEISIFDSVFRASEILYEIEPESYRIALTEFLEQPTNSEEET